MLLEVGSLEGGFSCSVLGDDGDSYRPHCLVCVSVPVIFLSQIAYLCCSTKSHALSMGLVRRAGLVACCGMARGETDVDLEQQDLMGTGFGLDLSFNFWLRCSCDIKKAGKRLDDSGPKILGKLIIPRNLSNSGD
ncbi:hypothetical protein H1C71_021650 [Ictidomys tridecemlineatus]|nr:hypothetical protein H1C71_021650 [Ictidomys tridecemlineatus]